MKAKASATFPPPAFRSGLTWNSDGTLRTMWALQLSESLLTESGVPTLSFMISMFWTHLANWITEVTPLIGDWWRDVVSLQSSDGRFEGTVTKAVVKHDGTITWTAPANYKSACTIDVTFFPFDLQNCSMKFGSWTYDGSQVSVSTHRSENLCLLNIHLLTLDLLVSFFRFFLGGHHLRRLPCG